jgi:HNH endonuclease
VFARDGFQCSGCGVHAAAAALTIDHIHPVSLGGTNDESNLQTLCRSCNSSKGAEPDYAARTGRVDSAVEHRARHEAPARSGQGPPSQYGGGRIPSPKATTPIAITDEHGKTQHFPTVSIAAKALCPPRSAEWEDLFYALRSAASRPGKQVTFNGRIYTARWIGDTDGDA